MSKRFKTLLAGGAVAAATAAVVFGVALTASADTTAPGVKSASVLAFAPNGVLLVGDSLGGQVVAIETGDVARAGAGKVEVQDLTGKIAAALGTTAEKVTVNDIAVNPRSGAVYIAVSRGTGADAQPAILKADRSGALSQVDLSKAKMSHVALVDKPTQANQAAQTITDIGYVDGKVLVAGLSNEEFSSAFRTISYPFKAAEAGSQVEMYHGSHARYETNSPVRTFLTYDVAGKPTVLAAYTCTPIVKIPVADLKPGAKVKATTIAELGNMNRPLDMIAYKKDGKQYFLMANSARGVMKLDANGLEKYQSITTPVKDKAGIPYDTLADLKGVTQLDKVDDANAVIVVAEAGKPATLRTIGLP